MGETVGTKLGENEIDGFKEGVNVGILVGLYFRLRVCIIDGSREGLNNG